MVAYRAIISRFGVSKPHPVRPQAKGGSAVSPSLSWRPPSTGSSRGGITMPTSSIRHLGHGSELSLAEAADAKAAAATRAPLPEKKLIEPSWPDPVNMKMISIHEAEQLVRNFHQDLNPLIKILDLHLHTHDYVRSSSTVLYAAMLAAAAKFFRKDIYPQLLSQAQQLVTRAMSETLSHIGVIKAICILIYWKESGDRSSWMRVGWCVRLGYQLKLNYVRNEPLPADEFEARLVLDRERTWINLLCFDATYRRNHDFDQTPHLPVPTQLAIDKWVEETVKLGNLEDIYLAASLDSTKIHNVIFSLESTAPAGVDILRAHCRELIQMAEQKYYSAECEILSLFEALPARSRLLTTGLGTKTLVGTATYNKTRMSIDSIAISLSSTRLRQTNFNDPMALADFSEHVSNMVATLEMVERNEGLLDRLQDTIAMTLFSLGELLAKLVPIVGPGPMQQNIFRWLTQIFNVCTRCTDREDGAPAFIARFYRLLLLHSASVSVSMPPTRAASPVVGEQASATLTQEAYKNPFEELGWMFPDGAEGHQNALQSTSAADNEYWETLFPGASTDVMTWLDPTQFASV
ncbi:hypothetical protein MNV49_001781 [Pseudohyphozyma bogoriensis]|nr:hypothetical protein MNV49_001781 [Pseudohyphozyma bogoriensis]